MKSWTESADVRLAQYLEQRVTREGLTGAEAEELKEDLRCHLFEEAEKLPTETISLLHLESILQRMDLGEPTSPPAAIPAPHKPAPAAPAPAQRQCSGCQEFLHWTFGVILPAIVILLECITSFCGSKFFNPIPTPWHVLLVALVPIVNFCILRGWPFFHQNERLQGAAAGFTLIVAGFYAALFLPILHLSLLALILFGLGLLSLSPILAALVSWRLGKRNQQATSMPEQFRHAWRLGAIAASLALIVPLIPGIWTRWNLTSAQSGSDSSAAIQRLRTFHSERVLLQACYENAPGSPCSTDISGWVFSGKSIQSAGIPWRDSLSNARAREIYFLVTGKLFQNSKPPILNNRMGNFSRGIDHQLSEFEFDENLGGNSVAVRLKHLDLSQSRLDGHLDSKSRIGYAEWTLVFHNLALNAQEARCLIRLPQGGHVSRLTLWIEGEPHEAAFSTVSKVKAAYKEVAVVQRRDPVLATMVSPDTVLVQCFPVPSNGEMKIRLGITAPFTDSGWQLPRILERNFGIPPQLNHSLWLQSDQAFALTSQPRKESTPNPNGHALSTTLASGVLEQSPVFAESSTLKTEPTTVWCEDRFASGSERILFREPLRTRTKGSGKLVMVIDGSASLATHRETLAAVLDDSIIALLADDIPRRIQAADLMTYRFNGGRNNEEALIQGIQLARENGNLPLVWVHGPQVQLAESSERIAQILERSPVRLRVHTIEAAPGPIPLENTLYRYATQTRGPSLTHADSLRKDLSSLLLDTETLQWTWRYSAQPGPSDQKVWDQLATLWAASEAENPASGQSPEARSKLAATYQVVTSISGAVVLETKEQYAKHGLNPVDANATPQIPSVPEPSASLLLIFGASFSLLRRKRSSRRST